jgi:hopanoid biosynthesis associated protein HpnK
MRRLIINADDFGMTIGVNRAIAAAHRAGTVTSATVMANEAATDDAIAIASQNPSLRTGCHIVLVDGKPLSKADEVPTLIGSHNGGGASLRGGISRLAIASVTGRVRAADVGKEAAAQIERLRARALSLSHVDCHMHSHILPEVLRAVLQVAKDHGVGAIRNPFEPAWSVAGTHKISSLRSWNRSAQVTALRALQPQFHRAVDHHGMKTTDGTIGIAVTGLLDRNLLSRLVHAMPDGTWELVTHPGYNDRALMEASTELKQSRVVEFELLASSETLDLLRKRDIQLINYSDL